MADIFISYARADQKKIEPLAAALKARNFDVWWDRQLVGGTDFSAEIEREIEKARVVIVAWSNNSLSSKWVRDEASFARDHEKLIPILLDNVSQPMGFRQVHSIEFSKWNGNVESDNFVQLSNAIDRILGRPADMAAISQAAASMPSLATLARRHRIAFSAAGVAAFAVMAIAAFNLYSPSLPSTADQQTNERTPPISNINAQRSHASLAILPLKNLSEKGENDYLAAGVSAKIIERLMDVTSIKVIDQSSSIVAREQGWDFRQIGEALKVNYLLDGSFGKTDDRTQITLNLIETAAGRIIWSGEFGGLSNEMLSIENQLISKVVSLMSDQLAANQIARIDEAEYGPPTDIDPLAYDLYLRGLAFDWAGDKEKSTIEKLEEYREIFKTVTNLAPNFVNGWLALAEAENLNSKLHIGGTDPEEAFEASKKAIDKAAELAPDSARVNKSYAELYHIWDQTKALEHAQRATSLNPNFSDAWAKAHRLMALTGRYHESLAAADQAFALDPLGEDSRSAKQMALAYRGRVDEALHLIEEDKSLPWYKPNFLGVWSSFFHAAEGRHDLVLIDGNTARNWFNSQMGLKDEIEPDHTIVWFFHRLFESSMTLGQRELAQCWGPSYLDALMPLADGKPLGSLDENYALLTDKIFNTVNFETKSRYIEIYFRTLAMAGEWGLLKEKMEQAGASPKLPPPPKFFQPLTPVWEIDGAQAFLETGETGRGKDWLRSIASQLQERLDADFALPVYYFDYARSITLLGDEEEALNQLELAIDKGYRSWRLPFEPAFSSIRETDAFKEILKKHDADVAVQAKRYKALLSEADDEFIFCAI